jgi:hypothetical protein
VSVSVHHVLTRGAAVSHGLVCFQEVQGCVLLAGVAAQHMLAHLTWCTGCSEQGRCATSAPAIAFKVAQLLLIMSHH